MGNYNPHAPYILGQEWVPIRDARYTPDDVVERGYTWYNNNTVIPASGAYYVAENPTTRASQACDLMAVYPAGTEDQTGPIKVLHIPVSSISATGNTDTAATFTALNNVSDDKSLKFTVPGSGQIALSFDTVGYSQQLFGKRILDVRLRYSLAGTTQTDLAGMNFYLGFAKDLATNVLYLVGADGTITGTQNKISTLSFTDLNPFWDATANVNLQRDIYPWRYPELNRFAFTEPPASRMVVLMQAPALPTTSGSIFFYFADLEVVYCEEQRVRYGGRRTCNMNVGTCSNDTYDLGAQFVRLVDTNFASGTSLAPGRYTTTVVHNELGINIGIEGAPKLSALRELYQLQHQQGIRVDQSLIEDDTFVVEADDVLAHLTLHTAAGIVTGSHAYGTQDEIPIYGATTAIQEIEDDPVPAAALFPQVRFYARRFGDTTVALRLIDVATGLSTASISVADFDALPEIVDGWKEVTLRLSAAPSFAATGGDIDWRWDAVGETAGNQWQVLGADGPSAAGTQATGVATYYAPQGDTVTLTWQSPPISGTANDTLSDAVLIFSQDPLPVSGFAISLASQVVTGIGLDCGTPPGCIPTGIGYVNLTWTAQVPLPVTGFGAYELERLDATTGTWQQIMNATTPSVTGFADFEARVGQTSWYRIRTCNVLDFCGPWVTGSATPTAPGVAILGGDGNSVLIFTSNKSPGGNLAYVMQWEGEPIETFIFPEASAVQLRELYGKDFFTAFHPLERGGEQFARSILVNAAAVTPPSLANFKRLRDLGWASLPYVCVRDELGNRWYANVRVPDGTVRMNRTVYVAQIQVAEVTSTPFPVDPGV